MELGKKFNQLTLEEYFFYIDNYKKYKDFNTLGLYRSILENEKLSLADKIALREYAHKTIQKTYNFLQLKDLKVYTDVTTLGQELTTGDELRSWEEVRKNQQRMLADKRIKHRNFGDFAKHTCGYDDCVWNGLMIRQASWLAESNMHFVGDKNSYQQKRKSEKRKTERKNAKHIINREIDNE